MSRNRYENPSHKTYDDLFGDDFEVVYEEELPPIRPNDTFPEKDTGSLDNEWDDITDKWADDYDSTWDDDTEDGWDDDIESSNSKKKKGSKNNRKQEDSREKKKSRRRPNVVSPVKKTVQTGAKAVSSIIRMICKIASLVILAVIIYILATHFFEGLTSYGNPSTAISEKNYVMAAYAAFAVFVLLFEILSFFWSLSGPRVSSKNGRSYQADTGRGMSVFILTGAGSYLARMTAGLIPASPAPLTGLSGAVEIFGSLSATLIPLCIAGIISCILRRIFSR